MSLLSPINDDPRHRRRIKIVQNLYSLFFNHQNNGLPFPEEKQKVELVIKNVRKINPIIEESAPRFSIKNISKIDLAILYLAIFELLIERITPPKVIINEAVQLGKEMGGEKSYSFINAVLGKIYQIKKTKNE